VLHGFQTAAGVANILANSHAGILTSEFEGMPFSVLETLAVGRPMGAVNLPQLACVIKDGLSGTMISRSTDEDEMAERLADAFANLHTQMATGAITPQGVASAIADFTPQRQLAKCYANHRAIQSAKYGTKIRSA
jgi:glycosyltransferase involved in cell wall biosynthesis